MPGAKAQPSVPGGRQSGATRLPAQRQSRTLGEAHSARTHSARTGPEASARPGALGRGLLHCPGLLRDFARSAGCCILHSKNGICPQRLLKS